MAFNGSGTFVRLYSWVTDALNALFIDATRMDAEMNGMATALSDCVTRDGQSPATANIPLGGFKITGLANGTLATDAAAYGQLAAAANEWTAEALAAAYVSVTSFKLTAGDATARFTAGRRMKSTNTGGTIYSTVVSATYGAPDTTIVVVNDSGVLDAGLTGVTYGQQFVNPSYLDPRTQVILDNNSVDLVLASTAAQKISFGREVVDSLAEYASGTWTCKYPGIYDAKFAVAVTIVAGSPVAQGFIYKNGSAAATTQCDTTIAGGNAFVAKAISCVAGDTIEFYAQRDGTANSVSGRNDLTYASITRVL